MQGLHLTADLRDCLGRAALMTDVAALRALCLAVVAEQGLTSVGELFHRFTPAPSQAQSGITGVVLLAESHLAVHTWPEIGGVTLDAYVCNLNVDNSWRARCLMDRLINAFEPRTSRRQELWRAAPTE